MLDTLVESARRLCDAQNALIVLRDGELYRVAARHGLSQGLSQEFQEYFEKHPLTLDRGSAIGRAVLEGRLAHIPDVLADPGYSLSEAQKIGNYRATMSVPLLRNGSPIGAIAVGKAASGPFTAKQIELVSTFADQAVIAIENVRLFDEVQACSREGSAVGVMAMARTRVQPFSARQIELVTTFADQAVIAIENVRLFDEVQARSRELSESLEQRSACAPAFPMP